MSLAIIKKGDLKAKKQQVDEAFAGKLSDLSREQWRELAQIMAPFIVLAIAIFWLAYQFVEPAPPKVVVMSTGGETGAYHAFAKSYAKSLAKSRVKLELRTSAGSIENVKRLKDASSPVSVALLQGGITNSQDSPEIKSVGRVFLEPLWIFYRASEPLSRLSELKGRRIAIGPEGSGTRHLALALLARNGIDAASSGMLPLTSKPAVDALREGKADAVFLTIAPEAPLIQEVVRDRSIGLLSLDQAEAYTRIFPYLSRIVLPKGAFDLVENVPSRDVEMVAPMAVLAIRETLHPAIVGLIVEAAQEAHSRGGMFHRAGEFPKSIDPEFEVSEDAARYYKDGPNFFKRFLPFWLATLVERLLYFLVPIATVLVPVFKLGPALYTWRIKRRLSYWYAQLNGLDQRISRADSAIERETLRIELSRIERGVAALPVPVGHSPDYYDLRGAVDFVDQRLRARLNAK